MSEFLEHIEPKRIVLMLAAIVLLILAAEVMYLLWPQFKDFREINESHNLLMRAVSSSDGLEQQLTKTEAAVQSLSHQLHGDMAGLPAQQMESYIIGRLQKVSWETNVELVSVKPGDGQTVQMFQESLFEVELNAGYFDFFKWLQTIGRDLGFIVIKKYGIQPLGSELSDPDLKIALTMVSYRVVKQ
ncbi:MAG: hypothetical protein DIZ78_11230 [endosymbiont of Escarpia spicata]|uniref:Uncharacterized protein n=1 Tax=endosymbiont of Escarpia spicata TaxID=2200908 RepID=A0A370DKX0_9GAMM|nr:MAG: hypothetical protein DIZ78_11230 [endosymbiont of Escarpia spicata]